MRKNEERFKNPAKPANGAIGDREYAEAADQRAIAGMSILPTRSAESWRILAGLTQRGSSLSCRAIWTTVAIIRERRSSWLEYLVRRQLLSFSSTVAS
jgi:hypothetical protein